MRLDSLMLSGLFLVGSVAGCGSKEKEVREVSASPRMKAKSGAIWRNDLARALELEPGEICRELGLYDCVDYAHRITMGGVEPERMGIDEPLAEPPSSAPIAFDRTALSACAARLDADRSGSPVIFGPVLAADTAEARAEVATTLVQRVLSREPTQDQVDGLVGLYDSLAPLSNDPVADWSVGACLVVTTSVEALFY